MPRKGRSRRAPPAAAQITALRHDLMGHKKTPSMDPSTFVQLPWNNWTFERTYEVPDTPAVPQTYKVNDIINQIAVRVGLTSVENCRIKVQSISSWSTATGLGYPDVAAEFYELSGQQIGSIQYPRSMQRDKGTLNRPARVGYVYPLADRKEIFGSPEGLLELAKFTRADNCALTTRIQVLWQSGVTTTW